jgi:ABC-2 type transport system permease protein
VPWLTVFGQVPRHVCGIDTSKAGDLPFMTPGISRKACYSAQFFYGIAVSRERNLGIVHKRLVSPASRWSLVIG